MLIVFVPFVLAAVAVWEGIALSILWRWFVVPVTHWPTLSVAMAIGLALTLQLTRETRKPRDDERLFQFAMLFFRPPFFLFCGWVALQFVH